MDGERRCVGVGTFEEQREMKAQQFRAAAAAAVKWGFEIRLRRTVSCASRQDADERTAINGAAGSPPGATVPCWLSELGAVRCLQEPAADAVPIRISDFVVLPLLRVAAIATTA